MQKILLSLISLICISTVWGQNEFKAIIKDSDNKEVLAGANAILEGSTFGASADQSGLIVIKNIPDGKQNILFSYIGYQTKTETFNFPLTQPGTIEIFLDVELDETEELVVTATRSSRAIADIPTRIEPISGEELNEKANMKPGED